MSKLYLIFVGAGLAAAGTGVGIYYGVKGNNEERTKNPEVKGAFGQETNNEDRGDDSEGHEETDGVAGNRK